MCIVIGRLFGWKKNFVEEEKHYQHMTLESPTEASNMSVINIIFQADKNDRDENNIIETSIFRILKKNPI